MNDELASPSVRRALVADVVCVILFATMGRASHGEVLSPGGLLRTGTPFVLGLVVGWVIVVTARVAALRWLAGVVLWVSTLIVGMVVRYFTGQGVAVIFCHRRGKLLGSYPRRLASHSSSHPSNATQRTPVTKEGGPAE
ncbi:transmembrane protein [Cutibacterium acnes JCM 18918]|nr:transmembrane protein [Cutibacterium acnes JCM 18918]